VPFSPITLLRLHQTPGMGAKSLHIILTWANGSSAQLDSLFEMEASEISRRLHLKADLAAAIKLSPLDTAETLAEELYQRGVKLITPMSPNQPPLLYAIGSPELLDKPGLGFSGSRQASAQGLQHTTELARQAVQQDFSIISGHAPGVDVTAHKAALENNGITILVLPEGILNFKPRPELRELIENSPHNALVVSEFAPHMPWGTPSAMIRNETIIGLSRALIVIEAGEKGGSLATGQSALKRHVQVFVLNYADPPSTASGNRLLLNQGAQPIPLTPKVALPDLTDTRPIQLSLF
jgi:DNA protecting protein DprA